MAKVSAVDIQHKTFRKAFQGYGRAEVDRFLDELIESMEEESQSRAALEAEVLELRERIGHFKAMEESLQSTLLLAQRTADEVKAAAHTKAQFMLEEARTACDRETGAVDSRIHEARREYQHAIELAEKAKSELRSMLTMYLSLLDKQALVGAKPAHVPALSAPPQAQGTMHSVTVVSAADFPVDPNYEAESHTASGAHSTS